MKTVNMEAITRDNYGVSNDDSKLYSPWLIV